MQRIVWLALWGVLLTGRVTEAQVQPAYGWIFQDDRFAQSQLAPSAGSVKATVIGGTQFTGNGLQALVLDGDNTAINVTDAPGRLALMPTRSLSLEAWVVVRRPQPWGGIISAVRDNADDERGFILGFRDNAFCFGLATTDTMRITYLTAPKPFDTAGWHHVVATYDGATMKLYVDGELAATSIEQSGDIHALPNGWVQLGAYRDDDEFFRMRGLLHEANIYNRVLGEEQIKQHYEAKRGRMPAIPSAVQTPPLIVHGPFAQFVDHDKVQISWQTDVPTASIIEFGTSLSALERRTDIAPKTRHAFTFNIAGADPRAVYRYRITKPLPGGGGEQTRIYDFECEFNYTLPPKPLHVSPYPPDELSAFYSGAADRIIEATGVEQGFILVLGAEEGRLAYELAMRTDMKVIAVEPDAAKVQAARRILDKTGLYGTRIAFHQLPLGPDAKLPFSPYFANLIVSESMLLTGEMPCPAAEMYRLLKPAGGVAYLGQMPRRPDATVQLTRGNLSAWLQDADTSQGHSIWMDVGGVFWAHVRGPLPGSGEWTHQYGGADNAACSEDALIVGDMQVLWWGRPGPRPMPDRGPRNPAPLYAGGTLFIQGDRTLFGLDAYNGTVLWAMQMPEVRRANMTRDCTNMVAARDHLYLANGARAFSIGARTGTFGRSFDVLQPSGSDLDYDWGYIAVVGNTLLGSSTVRGGKYMGDQGEWYADDAADQLGKVTSESLFAYDRRTGRVKWTHNKGVIVNSSIAVHKGTIYFLEARDPSLKPHVSGRFEGNLPASTHLVAIDLETGLEKWAHSHDFTAFRWMSYLVVGDGAVVAAGTDAAKVYHILAFNDKTGEPLWNNAIAAQKTHHTGWLDHPVIVEQRLFANRHTFELCTGEILDRQRWDFHGCGVMSASLHTMFQRFEFHGMWDLDSGERTEMLGIRGGCWLGLIPAGGLLLAPESSAGCSCTHAIQTTAGYIPRKSDPHQP